MVCVSVQVNPLSKRILFCDTLTVCHRVHLLLKNRSLSVIHFWAPVVLTRLLIPVSSPVQSFVSVSLPCSLLFLWLERMKNQSKSYKTREARGQQTNWVYPDVSFSWRRFMFMVCLPTSFLGFFHFILLFQVWFLVHFILLCFALLLFSCGLVSLSFSFIIIRKYIYHCQCNEYQWMHEKNVKREWDEILGKVDSVKRSPSRVSKENSVIEVCSLMSHVKKRQIKNHSFLLVLLFSCSVCFGVLSTRQRLLSVLKDIPSFHGYFTLFLVLALVLLARLQVSLLPFCLYAVSFFQELVIIQYQDMSKRISQVKSRPSDTGVSLSLCRDYTLPFFYNKVIINSVLFPSYSSCLFCDTTVHHYCCLFFSWIEPPPPSQVTAELERTRVFLWVWKVERDPAWLPCQGDTMMTDSGGDPSSTPLPGILCPPSKRESRIKRPRRRREKIKL